MGARAGDLRFRPCHIRFDYMQARSTRTAVETFNERVGVCRDFAHLALTLCRCLNIPARYVNGHLGDIGVSVVDPMDFSAWIEVFLDGRWYTFDPRNNVPRIGRIVVARGRDAADIPLINSFGPHLLKSFRVWTYEVTDNPRPAGQLDWPAPEETEENRFRAISASSLTRPNAVCAACTTHSGSPKTGCSQREVLGQESFRLGVVRVEKLILRTGSLASS
jgi:hypothetical protein